MKNIFVVMFMLISFLSAEKIDKYKILSILQTGAGKKTDTYKIKTDNTYQKKSTQNTKKTFAILPTGKLPQLPISSQELAKEFDKKTEKNGIFTKVITTKSGGKSGSYAKEIDYN